MLHPRVPLIAVLSLLCLESATAQVSRTPPGPRMMQAGPPSARGVEAAKDWQLRLRRADDELRAGQWRRALRASERLIDEMLVWIENDEGAAPTLGLTLTLRALAEAGGGDVEAGRWDWLAAQALQPDL